MHRLQVYEGIRKNGNRTELVGLRCFASTSRKGLFALVARYLHGRYDLSRITVLLNGDGGSGYQFQDFERMVEGCRDHQYFLGFYTARGIHPAPMARPFSKGLRDWGCHTLDFIRLRGPILHRWCGSPLRAYGIWSGSYLLLYCYV